MPHGRSGIDSDTQNKALAAAVSERLGVAAESLDVLITSDVPSRTASHIVVTGTLTDALDAWDLAVPPQTIAGALWLPPSQADPVDTAVAWLLLRLPTPATPLSDLTDENERALRWSVAAATTVEYDRPETVEVDEQGVRDWADEQPQVRAIGQAVQRIGGASASELLDSVSRFRDALAGLEEIAELPPLPPTPELDAAVAEQLRQVQRSGFGRWRSGRERAAAAQATAATATQLAGDRLRAVIEARRVLLSHEAHAEADREQAAGFRESVLAAAAGLRIPATVDFAQVPRSFSKTAPAPRRYVLVKDADAIGEIPQAHVRAVDHLPDGTALCAAIQSGFSLPGVR